MLDLAQPISSSQEQETMNETVHHLKYFSSNGFRTLVVGCKTILDTEYNTWKREFDR